MAVISVNGDWINGYAQTLARASDDLAGALVTLRTTTMSSDAFGAIGRSLGAADAYARASTQLSGQVDRAVCALRSASDNLRTIAVAHLSLDERQAVELRQAHPR
jgi:hypothetical protein